MRKLTENEMAFFAQSALNYASLAKAHAAENAKPLDATEFEKVVWKKFAQSDEEYDSVLGDVRETQADFPLPKAS